MDPAIFFPSAGQSPLRARQACARCDVQRQCAQAAVAAPPEADAGVWGGLTVADRDRVRAGTVTLADAVAASRRAADGDVGLPATADAGPDARQWRAALQAVCSTSGLTVDVLLGDGQGGDVVAARRLLFCLLRESGWTLAAIGRHVGKDHSTVAAALRTLAGRPDPLLGEVRQVYAQAC